MSYSINKVSLLGNVGNDPEVRTFQNGNKVVNISLATTEKWKDKESGELKSNTEWHRVVIFNTLFVGIAERYIKKGSKIYIEGQLQTRKWQDNAGIDKYSTEIVLQNFRGDLVLLDRQSDEISNSSSSIEQSNKTNEIKNDANNFVGEPTELDDDIPF